MSTGGRSDALWFTPGFGDQQARLRFILMSGIEPHPGECAGGHGGAILHDKCSTTRRLSKVVKNTCPLHKVKVAGCTLCGPNPHTELGKGLVGPSSVRL
eukprot:6479099-Amphidinium_carterae.1